jgi:hypothetical protein
MAEGLLKWLVSESEEAGFVRDHFVVKVVPMLNPDGVVLGNFRASCAGRDLNRVFRDRVEALYPETVALKELVASLRRLFKSDLVMFLDLHGHSLKRNVFMYGP